MWPRQLPDRWKPRRYVTPLHSNADTAQSLTLDALHKISISDTYLASSL